MSYYSFFVSLEIIWREKWIEEEKQVNKGRYYILWSICTRNLANYFLLWYLFDLLNDTGER